MSPCGVEAVLTERSCFRDRSHRVAVEVRGQRDAGDEFGDGFRTDTGDLPDSAFSLDEEAAAFPPDFPSDSSLYQDRGLSGSGISLL
jgi:hypothetical protein